MASVRVHEDKKEDVNVVEQCSHLEAATHIVEIDEFRVLGLSQDDVDFYTNFPAEKTRKIFRKVREAALRRRRSVTNGLRSTFDLFLCWLSCT